MFANIAKNVVIFCALPVVAYDTAFVMGKWCQGKAKHTCYGTRKECNIEGNRKKKSIKWAECVTCRNRDYLICNKCAKKNSECRRCDKLTKDSLKEIRKVANQKREGQIIPNNRHGVIGVVMNKVHGVHEYIQTNEQGACSLSDEEMIEKEEKRKVLQNRRRQHEEKIALKAIVTRAKDLFRPEDQRKQIKVLKMFNTSKGKKKGI